MAKNVVYPALIKRVERDYLVYIPDLDIYTEGDGLAEAIASARDAIGLKAVDYLDDGKELPKASDTEKAIEKAKEDADEDFDYSDGILTFVDVDCEAYRSRLRNRAVKKNCTIPYWLSEKAEMAGVNFSKTLQEALMQKLNIG